MNFKICFWTFGVVRNDLFEKIVKKSRTEVSEIQCNIIAAVQSLCPHVYRTCGGFLLKILSILHSRTSPLTYLLIVKKSGGLGCNYRRVRLWVVWGRAKWTLKKNSYEVDAGVMCSFWPSFAILQYSKHPHIRTNGLRTPGWNLANKAPFL